MWRCANTLDELNTVPGRLGTLDHNHVKYRIKQTRVGGSEILSSHGLEILARERPMRGVLLVITIGHDQDSSCLRHHVAEPRKDAGRMPANRRQGCLRSHYCSQRS